jgi:hypothetical protein
MNTWCLCNSESQPISILTCFPASGWICPLFVVFTTTYDHMPAATFKSTATCVACPDGTSRDEIPRRGRSADGSLRITRIQVAACREILLGKEDLPKSTMDA